MSGFGEMFRLATRADRAALLPYLMAGIPDPEASPGLFAAMAEAGALPVGLGTRRLRTETAAMAMLASVQTLCDLHL